MGRLFRGKFLAGLERLFRKGALHLAGSCAQLDDPDVFRLLLDKLYRKEWRPYAKRPFAGPQQVYEYLGYYTHRVGIANHRLLQIDADGVRFKTRNGKTATVKGEEFIRRFLLHVLPAGFVKIRHYGLLAAKAEAKRQAVRTVLPPAPDPPAPESAPTGQPPQDEHFAEPLARLLDLALRCPRCGKATLLRRPLHERAPPGPQKDP
jgi:hypothetical protein